MAENARDLIRSYVRLAGDWWTTPEQTDARVERVYALVEAEVKEKLLKSAK